MKIRVLGCSGAESPGHNVPSFLLDGKILFDAGTITDVLDEKSQFRIKHIFITHAHLDHIKGLPFLADNIVVGDMNHTVTVMSIPPVIKTIKTHLFNSSMWPDFTVLPRPDDAILRVEPLSYGKQVGVNGYTVTPYRVSHTVPAVAYLVEDKRKKRFLYTGDMGPSIEIWKKIGKWRIDCLIIDVSFPNRMEDMALMTGHLTPLLLEEELRKMKTPPGRICVTHPKPRFLRSIKAELRKLRGDVRLLRDGETVII